MEFVYVVPRRHLFPHAYPHGMLPFTDEGERLQFEAKVVEHGFYVERERADGTLPIALHFARKKKSLK